MKKNFLFFFLFLATTSYAQQLATTDDGRRVKLNTNGTWQFADSTMKADTAARLFSKPPHSTTYIKSTRNRFGFWYDKSIWKMAEKLSNDASEFELSLVKGDGFAMFISERIEVDLENLKEIAVNNAREEDPNIKLEKEENRIINGQKVKYLQMSGEAHGIKFVYMGYYTSNESGTLQFVCYTAKNLLKNYEPDFQNLINGLVVSAQ